MAMLSPFLPLRTSLTLLGVPRDRDHVGAREAVLVHKMPDQVGNARRPARPLVLLISRDQAGLCLQARDIGRAVGVP
jgi:hypothetical protein